MKKSWIILFLSTFMLSSLIYGCQASTIENTPETEKATTVESTEVPETFEEIAKYLTNIAGVELPYFGGYNHKSQQIIVFSEKEDQAILWSGDTGNIEIIKKSEIPDDKRIYLFAEGKFNGIDTTFVMQENSPLMAFILAVHEGYHFYGQEWLYQIPYEHYIPRGIVYPENVEARVLMNAASKALQSYMENENSDGLKEALYFINQVKAKHSQDLNGNLSTGLAEGTANFIEHIYVAIAKNPELKNNMVEAAKAAYEIEKDNLNVPFHDKTSEYYHIASQPLFYLAMNDKVTLMNEIKKGIHPLEMLNQLDTEKVTEINKQLNDAVSDYYENNNVTAKSFIDSFKTQSQSSDYATVKISTLFFPGSMEFGGFINYKDQGIYKTLNTQTTGKAHVNQGSIELINQDTYNSDDYLYFIFLVKKSDIVAGEFLSINTDTVKIDGVKYTESNGSFIIE